MELENIKKLIPENLLNKANSYLSILDEMQLGDSIKRDSLLYFLLLNKALTMDEIKSNFPDAVSNVSILDKLENISFSNANEDAENIRKMFFAITKDVRIIMAKIALVVNDVRHQQDFNDE